MTQNVVMAQPIVSSKRLSWYITILVIYGVIIAYGSFYFTQLNYLNTLVSDIRSIKYDIKNVSNNINDNHQDYLYLMKKENTSKVKPIVGNMIPNKTCSKTEEETVDTSKTSNKINSNMTIIDLLNNYSIFLEPYMYEYHQIASGHQPYFNSNKKRICSTEYLQKNLYPSKILNIEYQTVNKKNVIMLKLPQNTYCFGKEHSKENCISTNTELHPCSKMEFDKIIAWCNAPLLFEQFIEIVKAYEEKRLPIDTLENQDYLDYHTPTVRSTSILTDKNFIYYKLDKLFYNKEIYYNMISLF